MLTESVYESCCLDKPSCSYMLHPIRLLSSFIVYTELGKSLIRIYFITKYSRFICYSYHQLYNAALPACFLLWNFSKLVGKRMTGAYQLNCLIVVYITHVFIIFFSRSDYSNSFKCGYTLNYSILSNC